MTNPGTKLRWIKVVHTVVWAFFAGCVLAIPVLALQGRLQLAFGAIGMVALEVLILAVNSFRCPLTDVAARYTDERVDNFDIYLPLWLARWNKVFFGIIYVGGVVLTGVAWCRSG